MRSAASVVVRIGDAKLPMSAPPAFPTIGHRTRSAQREKANENCSHSDSVHLVRTAPGRDARSRSRRARGPEHGTSLGTAQPCCAHVCVSAGAGVSGSARMRDVSLSGAFLETTLPLPLFSQIAIAVRHDDGSRHAHGIHRQRGALGTRRRRHRVVRARVGLDLPTSRLQPEMRGGPGRLCLRSRHGKEHPRH